MKYLSVTLTDGNDGISTVEAMASTREPAHEAVMAEVAELVSWARSHFPSGPGPVEDGFDWDHELLVQREDGGWVTVTLTFSASAAFAEAFQARFSEAGDD